MIAIATIRRRRADWVGSCTTTLAPLVDLIRAHVLGAERIHGDDTTVCRCWPR